jgi:hypothetical protein
MYYRVLDLSRRSEDDEGGTFHYDTRRPEDDLRSEPGPIRIVTALSSDGTDISNVFTENPNHYGRSARDVIADRTGDLIWPGNGSLVLFDEELDLHAQPPAVPLQVGARAIFASAILRRPEHDVIACEALRKPPQE